MAEERKTSWVPKVLASPAGAAGAAVVGGIAAAYTVANSSVFHRGDSGLGSCTRASDVLASFHSSGLKGKTIIVTGANSGLGLETARAFAAVGARVVLPCRSMEKAKGAEADIAATCAKKGVESSCIPMVLDLNDLDSVRTFVTEFRALGEPLTALICNAGIMALKERQTTKQGFEAQIGVCHLAHFLLANLLLPELRKAAPSRVVFVSSMGHRAAASPDWVKSDTLEGPTGYKPWEAYGYAKLSNIVTAREWNERFGGEGVTAYSLHPGGIFTNLQGHVSFKTMLYWKLVAPFFFKSTEQGAATSVFCAAHPMALAGAGGYFEDCNLSKCQKEEWVEDAELRRTLWEKSEAMVGLTSSSE